MKTALPKLSEAEFTSQVMAIAKLHGWRAMHIRPARTAKGWRTPVQGDGAGFPDLFAVHPKRGVMLFAELKVGRNKPTPEQAAWLDDLRETDAIVRVWTDSDWPEIEAVLQDDQGPGRPESSTQTK